MDYNLSHSLNMEFGSGFGEYNPTDDKWLGWSVRSGVALVETTDSLFCYDEASCNLFY